MDKTKELEKELEKAMEEEEELPLEEDEETDTTTEVESKEEKTTETDVEEIEVEEIVQDIKDMKTQKIIFDPKKYFAPINEIFDKLAYEYTDAPPAFIEGAKYFAISTLLGKYFIIEDVPRQEGKATRPNIWIILSGMSGKTRKSTVINSIAIFVVKTALLHANLALMGIDKKKMTKKEYREAVEKLRKQIDGMFIEEGSVEGILDHIVEEYEKGNEQFIMKSVEFGGVLKGLKSVSYMTRLSSLFSSMYYGESKVFHFVKSDRYLPPGIYVTAILGMQEPWLYLDAIMFYQGLMRRTILIYQTPEDKRERLDYIDPRRKIVEIKMEEAAMKLGENLSKFLMWMKSLNIEYISAKMLPEARELVNEWGRKWDAEISTSSIWNRYTSSLEEQLAKLAVLDAILNNPYEAIISKDNIGKVAVISAQVYVTKENVERALKFLLSFLEKTKQAILRVETPINVQPLEDVSAIKEMIINAVRAVDGKKLGITDYELADMLHLRLSKLRELLLELVESGKLIVMAVKKGKKKEYLFFPPEKEAEVSLYGKKVNIRALKLKWNIR